MFTERKEAIKEVDKKANFSFANPNFLHHRRRISQPFTCQPGLRERRLTSFEMFRYNEKKGKSVLSDES
jgi:hypothetical protein